MNKDQLLFWCNPKIIDFDLLPDELISEVEEFYRNNKELINKTYGVE